MEELPKEILDGIPKELLQFCQQVQEGLLATGKRLDEEAMNSIQSSFILGVAATMCYLKEPDQFPRLKDHIADLIMAAWK